MVSYSALAERLFIFPVSVSLDPEKQRVVPQKLGSNFRECNPFPDELIKRFRRLLSVFQAS